MFRVWTIQAGESETLNPRISILSFDCITVYDLLLIFSHLQESIKHPEEESDDATDIRTLCPTEEVKYLKSLIIVNWFGVLK